MILNGQRPPRTCLSRSLILSNLANKMSPATRNRIDYTSGLRYHQWANLNNHAMRSGIVNLRAELQNYGICGTAQSLRLFSGTTSPELLDYLDLVEPRHRESAPSLMPDGVAESQGRPLLFFVNHSRLAQAADEQRSQLDHLRRSLACRGDRAYLAVVRSGTLDVVPVSLGERSPDWEPYRAGTNEALTFFSRLAHGKYDGKGRSDPPRFCLQEDV